MLNSKIILNTKPLQIIIFFSAMIIISKCGKISLERKTPFQIEWVKCYNWVGGQPGIRGVLVKIKLKETPTVKFDSLFFRNKIAKIDVKKNSFIVSNYYDTSILRDLTLSIDPRKEIKNKPPKRVNFPFVLKKNEAVLSYFYKNKLNYYKIKGIKEDSVSEPQNFNIKIE